MTARNGDGGNLPTATDKPEVEKPFERALADAVQALEDAHVPYVLMGGVSSAALGRPRNTRDIDIFVAPEGSFPALQALAGAGFRTEETNPRWLYKAWKYGVMVDVIFRSSGDRRHLPGYLVHGLQPFVGGDGPRQEHPPVGALHVDPEFSDPWIRSQRSLQLLP